MIKMLMLVSVNLCLLTACASSGEGYMQPKDLNLLIERKHSPLIVDVRSSFEFKSGRVPGAIHIPFWQSFTTDKLDSHQKSQPLILYCEHGPRAGIAKLAFSLAGFEQIRYLQGHMSGWRSAGFPLEINRQTEDNFNH